MRILLTLLLQTVYIFNCYFSETFLELNSLTKATTSISHLWNALICVVNLNTIIDISVTLLFTLFGCLKWLNEVYIHCFIVIQVIDDRIYFDLPSVQNVNSNNYFRCLYEWAVLFHWTQYTNRHLLIVCRQRSFSGLLCVCLCW